MTPAGCAAAAELARGAHPHHAVRARAGGDRDPAKGAYYESTNILY